MRKRIWANLVKAIFENKNFMSAVKYNGKENNESFAGDRV